MVLVRHDARAEWGRKCLPCQRSTKAYNGGHVEQQFSGSRSALKSHYPLGIDRHDRHWQSKGFWSQSCVVQRGVVSINRRNMISALVQLITCNPMVENHRNNLELAPGPAPLNVTQTLPLTRQNLQDQIH
jgi:hypothetical protein